MRQFQSPYHISLLLFVLFILINSIHSKKNLRFAKVSGVYQWIVDSIKKWDCSQRSEKRERLLGAPEVPDSPFESLFEDLSCAYIMDDTTIR